MKNLPLTRPLAVLDLETTGPRPDADRIVEVSVLKLLPGGDRQQRTRRVNPGVPIPAEATRVHGITDDDVRGEPKFAAVARGLVEYLDGCDLCGFNIIGFDLRMLCAEFGRAKVAFPLEGRAVIDAMKIFHRREPRDLSAAVRFYLGREHDAAHSAAGDVLATAEILDAMLERYGDLPRSAAELERQFGDPGAVDSGRKFIRVGDRVQFNFGKHRGQPLDVVAREDPSFLKWMLAADFAADTKAVVEGALARVNGCRA